MQLALNGPDFCLGPVGWLVLHNRRYNLVIAASAAVGAAELVAFRVGKARVFGDGIGC